MTPAAPTTLMRVRGQPITWDGTAARYTSALTIDADGSPRAYGPLDSGLDHTANAGHPGDWWGIVVDRNGNPIVQGDADPYPGLWVSTTTYERRQFGTTDPRRYLNAELTPFGVIPSPLRTLLAGVCIGARMVVTNTRNGRQVEAVCGDVGPSTHLGEGSIALAKALGLASDARTGGTDDVCLQWALYPDVAAMVNGEKFELQPMRA